MFKSFTFLFSLLSFNAFAETSFIVIAYGAGSVPVHSSIDVDAEYVAMSVSISSDAKYPSERVKLIRELHSSIQSAAARTPYIEFQQGIVSISPREKSSFSLSSRYDRGSGASLYILSKTDSAIDVYSATQNIYAFLNQIQEVEDTSVNLGNTTLAISSPHVYRNQLLAKVREEIESTKKTLGTSYKASISGLENPVIVRQKNNKQVTLFIDYRLQFNE